MRPMPTPSGPLLLALLGCFALLRPAIGAETPQKVTGSAPTSQKAGKPPNFVVIFTDDQGYEDVGCFGSKQIRTPRLDQMAMEGMKFTYGSFWIIALP